MRYNSPVSEEDLAHDIAEETRELDPRENRFWERIRVPPARWSAGKYAECVGGFWVVGLLGVRCLHLNEVEGGFTWGRYSTPGTIDKIGYDQDELCHAIYKMLFAIDEGGIF